MRTEEHLRGYASGFQVACLKILEKKNLSKKELLKEIERLSKLWAEYYQNDDSKWQTYEQHLEEDW